MLIYLDESGDLGFNFKRNHTLIYGNALNKKARGGGVRSKNLLQSVIYAITTRPQYLRLF